MVINDMLRNLQHKVDKLKRKVRFWDGLRIISPGLLFTNILRYMMSMEIVKIKLCREVNFRMLLR